MNFYAYVAVVAADSGERPVKIFMTRADARHWLSGLSNPRGTFKIVRAKVTLFGR